MRPLMKCGQEYETLMPGQSPMAIELMPSGQQNSTADWKKKMAL